MAFSEGGKVIIENDKALHMEVVFRVENSIFSNIILSPVSLILIIYPYAPPGILLERPGQSVAAFIIIQKIYNVKII